MSRVNIETFGEEFQAESNFLRRSVAVFYHKLAAEVQ